MPKDLESTHQSETKPHAPEVRTAVTHKSNLTQFASMMENIPINVIMADLDLNITYMNPASIKQLKVLQHLLPVSVENMIGVSIDLFHQKPAHQRQILSSPNNLPHSSQIQLGEETLDLLVTAVLDDEGNYIGPMVTWEVITEKLKIENEISRVQNMMENLPINVMMANLDHDLVYMNATSQKTLKQLEHLLPKPLDELIGEKIDIFHENPGRIRQLLSNPSNLPHSANIQLGEEFLKLDVSAIYDKDNRFIGPMVCWEVISDRVKLTNEVMNGVKIVSTSATELQTSSKSLAAASEESSRQAQVVAAASEEATRNVETVSSASEQLSASITEIARHVQDASEITSKAVEEADSTNQTIEELSKSSDEIGRVTKVIASIAQQTNLLSLNATIEAARAGEVGKGFAVVANEVKELAQQSAKASKEISQKIDGIQSSTAVAVNAIGSIRATIRTINEISTTIASAVEEQTAATTEISRNVSEAAQGTAEVTKNIAGVSQAASESGKSSADIFTAADGLSQEAARLERIVKEFIGE